MPLDVRAFITEAMPPVQLVSSVRCVLLKGAQVMVIEDYKGEHHILPGGRVEANESFEESLQRELLEETGWTARAPRLLGVTHFHHLKEAPPDYPYPYPDFLQLIYVSEAGEHFPERQETASEWEADAAFREVGGTLALQLDPINRAFLQQATRPRAR
ncbi:MAG: NUDIX domain-containing protein [Gemmatimonadetes bacterium]|nr:NUDIX domain-containing protein [Gemmatimonadota bacterium]MBT7860266.1 NUDIX domain-containing protein [Gemmatimonadota bacterium]